MRVDGGRVPVVPAADHERVVLVEGHQAARVAERVEVDEFLPLVLLEGKARHKAADLGELLGAQRLADPLVELAEDERPLLCAGRAVVELLQRDKRERVGRDASSGHRACAARSRDRVKERAEDVGRRVDVHGDGDLVRVGVTHCVKAARVVDVADLLGAERDVALDAERVVAVFIAHFAHAALQDLDPAGAARVVVDGRHLALVPAENENGELGAMHARLVAGRRHVVADQVAGVGLGAEAHVALVLLLGEANGTQKAADLVDLLRGVELALVDRVDLMVEQLDEVAEIAVEAQRAAAEVGLGLRWRGAGFADGRHGPAALGVGDGERAAADD
mmetsp:Transcript_24746/g.69902  ORF Transcript_24746/g.69902 Transcript_24746/m.69902 type:complete len:334 (-) Transcript_24746:475-1476(-)